MVGLEGTVYTVSEDVGTVKVCALASSLNNSCPVAFSFNVRLSTHDESAGITTHCLKCMLAIYLSGHIELYVISCSYMHKVPGSSSDADTRCMRDPPLLAYQYCG